LFLVHKINPVTKIKINFHFIAAIAVCSLRKPSFF
jgi:hypothetical protein